MPLIILLAIAVAAGYFIARSRASKKIDETAASVADATRAAASKTSSLLRGHPSAEQLKSWSSGAGAEFLPQEFNHWLAGLGKDDASAFTGALSDHMSGLGYSLKELLEGKLAGQQEQVKARSEAIAAYSQVYRQAHGN